MKERIDRLLFTPCDPEPFALLRLGLGLAAFFEFLSYAPYVKLFFSGDGYLPWATLERLGPTPGPLYLLGVSDHPLWTTLCYVALLLTALLFAAGVRTRWTGPLLWLLQASFVNRNVFSMAGASLLNLQLLWVILWVDTGRAWSVGQRVRESRGIPSWVRYLVTLQMAVLYFKSGFNKLMGKAWMQGDAIKYMLANPSWRRWNLDGTLLQQEWFLRLCEALTQLTWSWELAFPFLLLHRKTRLLALLIGLTLHAGQFVLIGTGSFPLLLLSTYACLLPPEDFRALKLRAGSLFTKARARWSESSKPEDR